MKYIALIGCLLLFPSCSERGSLATTKPSLSEVAGRYSLSRTNFGEAIDSEIRSKAAHAYIELKADGTASLSNVPVVPESRDHKFAIRRYHSGIGTFSIAPLGSTSKSNFYGLYLDCGDLPDPMDTPRFRLAGDSLFLSIDYFDGDFTQRMVFTRFDNQPAE